MINARRKFMVGAALVAVSLVAVATGARAQANLKATDPFPEGALAPDNLTKPRPKPPFDMKITRSPSVCSRAMAATISSSEPALRAR